MRAINASERGFSEPAAGGARRRAEAGHRVGPRRASRGHRRATLVRAEYHLGITSELSRENGAKPKWMWQPPPKPFKSGLPPPLEPFWDETGAEQLSPKGKGILERDQLAWATRRLKDGRR